ncbi:MAG TPA: cysteine--tRNA ligase, partial [Candidatus Omnitrophota bacterium]|nr:cysteine--tRNA ligase [Candidatus Omnitrophota bacterium]
GIVTGALKHITVFLKDIFNLELSVPAAQEVEPEVLALLEQRAQARKERNFAESDRLRDVLQQRGILVQDTKDGQSWRRL